MSMQVKKTGVIILISLILTIIIGNFCVLGALTDFKHEAHYLIGLKIISPEMDLKQEVSVLQYVTLLEKLLNGRSKEDLINLTAQIEIPDVSITYYEALTITGLFMGHDSEVSFNQIKALTPELSKNNEAKLTGYEMAYVFYQLLNTKRVGSLKTLLEERYIIGKNPRNISKIVEIRDQKIILEDRGVFKLAEDVQAFIKNEDITRPAELSRVMSGLGSIELLFDEQGCVKTIVLHENYPSKIRVLLSRNLDELGSSRSYDFSEIKIKATQPFKLVVLEDGVEKIILVAEKDEVITFTNDNGLIRYKAGNGGLTGLARNRIYLRSYYRHDICFEPLLTSAERENIPVYAGTLEIFPSMESGYLNLINELPLEMYLRRVVPAQIPNNWPEETFRVQAIAARSYALNQMIKGRFKEWSAHVDDSTASQIYNNMSENPLINQAISDTEGIVALYDGQIIEAVYFSTSAGYTANNEEVWHHYSKGTFPGLTVPYLRAKEQIIGGRVLDLTNEMNALAFFKNHSLKSYDSGSPYFRWVLELSREELENTINNNLALRERADRVQKTDFIQTLMGLEINPDDRYFSIGKLKDIKVVQRGQGGNIMVLDIIGSNGTYRVMKEYNIRHLIRPNRANTNSTKEIIIKTHNNEILKDFPILPSAFIAFDIIKNSVGEIEKIKIYGGGMGHGVGLSQWGMKGMALKGYDYEEILKHYYTGINLEKIY